MGGDPTGGGENSITVEAQLDGDPGDETIVADTDLFAVEPQGPEQLAQLGIVASLGGNPIVALAAPITLRPNLGLDLILSDMPRLLFELVPIRLVGMDVTINGLVNGTAFTRMPSSCAPSDYRLTAVSYDSSAQKRIPATSPFAPIGCPNGLSFAPQIAGEITKETGSNAVTFKTTLTQALGEAAVKGAALTLPGGLAPRLPDALTRACPVTTAAGDCPATAKVGSLTAWTPVFANPADPNSVMTAGQSLCTTDQVISGELTAQSGTTARDSAKVTVQGCDGSRDNGLTGKVWFRGLATKRPRMGFAIGATKDSPRISTLVLKLPDGLRVVRRHLARGLKLRADSKPVPTQRVGSTKGSLRIRRAGATKLTGTLYGAALRVDPSLKRRVRAGRGGRLTVIAKVTRAGTPRQLRLTANAR